MCCSSPCAPWRAREFSVALVKLDGGLQLSGHLDAEVKRARTSLALPDQIGGRTSYPDAPGSGIAACARICANWHRACRQFAAKHPLDPSPCRRFQKPFDLAGASNAWAAARDRSASGDADRQ